MRVFLKGKGKSEGASFNKFNGIINSSVLLVRTLIFLVRQTKVFFSINFALDRKLLNSCGIVLNENLTLYISQDLKQVKHIETRRHLLRAKGTAKNVTFISKFRLHGLEVRRPFEFYVLFQ